MARGLVMSLLSICCLPFLGTRPGARATACLMMRLSAALGVFLTVVALGFVFGPVLAIALEGPTTGTGAVSATAVSLPDGPASVAGLADAANVQAFSGQVGYSVPIQLPAGRQGLGRGCR